MTAVDRAASAAQMRILFEDDAAAALPHVALILRKTTGKP